MLEYDDVDQIITDTLKGDIKAFYKLQNIYDNAKIYLNLHKYIFDKLQIKADSNKYAQITLGYMYEMGLGIDQDYQKAIKWYKLSRNQGIDALYNLGRVYDKIQDYQKSFKWHKLNADRGHMESQNRIGYMYTKGLGTRKDDQVAIKYYKLSAYQGDAYAQYNLGIMYYNKSSTKHDYREAIKWFKISANQGDPDALQMLEKLLGNKQIVLKLLPTLIKKIYEQNKLLEHLKLLSEHLKLYPGSNIKEAEKDFYLLIKK